MVLGRFVSPLDFSASCSSSLLQAKVHVHTLRSSLCREPRVNLESISLGLGPPPPLCPPRATSLRASGDPLWRRKCMACRRDESYLQA